MYGFVTPPKLITIKRVKLNSNYDLMNDRSNGGFLSGFVEEGVEKPVDGLNGECIVHYSGHHSNCIMKVNLME